MNTEQRKIYRKRYYWENRKKALIAASTWRKDNKSRAVEISRRWRSANPNRFKLQSRRYCQKRYASKKSAIHPDINLDIEKALFEKCQELTDSTGIIHHLDHIIPLAHGGWHHHLNLQPLPYSVNQSKNDNPIWEIPGYKCWRDVPEFLWPEKLKDFYKKLLTY